MKTVPIIISTVFTAIELFIYVKTLQWLFDLNKIDCKCSNDKRKEFIEMWIQIYIAISIAMYFFNVYYLWLDNGPPVGNIISLIKFIVAIFSMVNMILSIQYIQNLKDIDCSCSEDTSREMYFIYNWIKIGFIVLLFTILLLFALWFLILYLIGKNKK
jgi:hypothetical protein